MLREAPRWPASTPSKPISLARATAKMRRKPIPLISQHGNCNARPAVTISVVRLPERRGQEMMVIAALRRLDVLQLVR